MQKSLNDPDDLAERRRRALKRVFDAHGVNPTDVSRRAGLKSPNLIYNFFAGRTKSLTASNYQKIAKVLPGVTMEELSGEQPKKTIPPVLVKTQCQAGLLHKSFFLPEDKIREVPLPVDDAAQQDGVFAADVMHPGADLIYPEHSILVCLPIDQYKAKITKNRRLLVKRLSNAQCEVTVREVQEDSEGRLWLSQRCSDPRFTGSVKMPAEITEKVWRDKGEKYAIAGVVIGAFIPES